MQSFRGSNVDPTRFLRLGRFVFQGLPGFQNGLTFQEFRLVGAFGLLHINFFFGWYMVYLGNSRVKGFISKGEQYNMIYGGIDYGLQLLLVNPYSYLHW